MLAVAATFDGKNFVTEEDVHFTVGQKVIITILNDTMPELHDKIDINKFAGSAGRLFSDNVDIDKYVKGMRENDRL